MQKLQEEFQKIYGPLLQTNKKPSEAQKDLLQSQLRTFYRDMKEADALNALLELSRAGPRDDTRLPEGSAAAQFMAYCERWKFAGFSFLDIVINAEGKKVPRGMPIWKRVTRENFPTYIQLHHAGFAFSTGHISGLTVIDCDTRAVYESLIEEFPALKDTLTVTTRKGAHIYCLYEPRVQNCREAFSKFPAVDIRNDGGIVFAPPTSYTLAPENVVLYEFVNPEANLLPFPSALVDALKSDFLVTAEEEEKEEKLISSVDDLSGTQVRDILMLFQCHRPHIINRIPVVLNGVFDIGFQPATPTRLACYYVSLFEMMRIDITHGDWPRLTAKLAYFADDMTFEVYAQGENNYVLFCLSHGFYPRDDVAMQLQMSFEGNPEAAQATLYNGWVTPVAVQGQTLQIRKMGRFGRAPVLSSFETLLNLTMDMIQHFNSDHFSADVLSVEGLRAELASNFQFPKVQVFISFQTDPIPETGGAGEHESALNPPAAD